MAVQKWLQYGTYPNFSEDHLLGYSSHDVRWDSVRIEMTGEGFQMVLSKAGAVASDCLSLLFHKEHESITTAREVILGSLILEPAALERVLHTFKVNVPCLCELNRGLIYEGFFNSQNIHPKSSFLILLVEHQLAYLQKLYEHNVACVKATYDRFGTWGPKALDSFTEADVEDQLRQGNYTDLFCHAVVLEQHPFHGKAIKLLEQMEALYRRSVGLDHIGVPDTEEGYKMLPLFNLMYNRFDFPPHVIKSTILNTHHFPYPVDLRSLAAHGRFIHNYRLQEIEFGNASAHQVQIAHQMHQKPQFNLELGQEDVLRHLKVIFSAIVSKTTTEVVLKEAHSKDDVMLRATATSKQKIADFYRLVLQMPSPIEAQQRLAQPQDESGGCIIC